MADDGHPVQIVRINEQIEEGPDRYELDVEAMREIFDRDDVRDRPICVLTVAGAMRQGKSFLLNFVLRYLKSADKENWIESEEMLSGFEFRGGSARETTGIYMWSQLFPTKTDKGEKAYIAIMDTQGCFDHEALMRDNSLIFGLSLLMSSVTIYNLFRQIKEDDLHHLAFFSEFGKLAYSGSNSHYTPFQKLLFLVRDWEWVDERPYGLDGGKSYVSVVLDSKSNKETKELRERMPTLFEDITCCLMPEPGKKVTKTKHFQGTVDDIEPDFLRELKALLPSLLGPKKMSAKTIDGSRVKGKEFVDDFSVYFKNFKENDSIQAQTLVQSMIENGQRKSLETSLATYVRSMDALLASDTYIEEDQLAEISKTYYNSAIELHASSKTMGGAEAQERYQGLLKDALDQELEKYKARNLKNKETKEKLNQAEKLRAEEEEAKVQAQREAVEAQMRQQQAEEQRLEEEKARIQAEQEAIEANMKQQEVEKCRIEEERLRMEAEQEKLLLQGKLDEAAKQALEDQRKRIELERDMAEANAQREASERARIEQEKKALEVERQAHELNVATLNASKEALMEQNKLLRDQIAQRPVPAPAPKPQIVPVPCCIM
eukprot:TRINITY_DN27537_c0_g1_i5.p1 TRINITY_DN27537_c0_g1~~TRINITY_DN27537_c0_g1_i5.p1  ORF type:complete len:614 (+),score=188.30 TRINITY_DN27537_c0_g1_i5:33-1844(+)